MVEFAHVETIISFLPVRSLKNCRLSCGMEQHLLVSYVGAEGVQAACRPAHPWVEVSGHVVSHLSYWMNEDSILLAHLRLQPRGSLSSTSELQAMH